MMPSRWCVLYWMRCYLGRNNLLDLLDVKELVMLVASGRCLLINNKKLLTTMVEMSSLTGEVRPQKFLILNLLGVWRKSLMVLHIRESLVEPAPGQSIILVEEGPFKDKSVG